VGAAASEMSSFFFFIFYFGALSPITSSPRIRTNKNATSST
jgi:hypothetical protein